ncbi:MAG: amino acid adenylation domain-containing protein, partial [Gammaproteobacteria bacterium]
PEQRLSDLPLLPEDERRRIIEGWNATGVEYPGEGYLPGLWVRQVARTPDAPAVLFGERVLKFRELNEAANRLANGLLQRGLGRDAIIGICAHRSLELVVGLLGVLKAGAAYLPLDPDYPRERLAVILEEARPSLVLVQARLVNRLPEHAGRYVLLDPDLSAFAEGSAKEPETVIHGEQLAYVLYTSGSTGRPKGVGSLHKGMRNRLLWMQSAYGLTAGDAVLQKTPYSFDVSVWEFFWPLITGARLVLAGPEDHKDPECLGALIERHGITTLHFVPSMLKAFLETADLSHCRSLRRVLASGEALSAELRDAFRERLAAELHNLYGPTEASIDVTYWDCARDAEARSVPIGLPIANTQIYLLDTELNPVPIGVSGELFIGGVGLARGYLQRPDLTAAAFLPDPFGAPGGRIYRTGDLARYRPDGAIEYLSRIDRQVKVRGFRIELEEIEHRLLAHPSVKQAVVVAREDKPGDKRLVAYLIPTKPALDTAASVEALRAYVGTVLPDYMVPSAFVYLKALPLHPNGKLDRAQLPAPDVSAELAPQYVAPRTDTETQLAQIWAEVLRVERIGIHDNFFALGG